MTGTLSAPHPACSAWPTRSSTGRSPSPAPPRPGAAPVTAGQVLQESAERRCRELARHQRTVARPRLILLRERGHAEIGEKAWIAWKGLSRACHHHSYELRPTVDEVRALTNLVKEIRLS